ncbi:MAG: hypothetical protein V1708_02820 [Candidatus Micrarchaeota archaeon]
MALDRLRALGKPGRIHFLRDSLFLAVAVRLLIIVLALVAANEVACGTPFDNFLPSALSRWDGAHYLHLAEHGYSNSGEERFLINFFPLFPLLIWLLNFLVGNYLVASLVLSFAGSVVAGFVLQKLAALDFGKNSARWSLAFFFLFPTAYFLAVPYTESVFAALALSSFYFARKRDWRAAGVAGMLATAVRWHGLALVPALAVEAWQQEGFKGIKRAGWLLVVPLGLLSYLALNAQVTGSPFSFVVINEVHWFHKPILPWDSLWNSAQEYYRNPFNFDPANEHMARTLCFAFSAVLLYAGRRRLRLSYQVFAWGSLVMLYSVTFQVGLPRYLLSIFPLFLVLGGFGSRHRISAGAILLASLALLCNYGYLFLKGWYAF